uniref:Uncharacterized protein n=1 Tax=Salix viminalis TaxID=40686 RepID=A0A6N2MQV9_SALVM
MFLASRSRLDQKSCCLLTESLNLDARGIVIWSFAKPANEPAIQAKKIVKRTLLSSETSRVPKSHFVVCVGETNKRFAVPISYLIKSMALTTLRKPAMI